MIKNGNYSRYNLQKKIIMNYYTLKIENISIKLFVLSPSYIIFYNFTTKNLTEGKK